jgi:hypothetical protein
MKKAESPWRSIPQETGSVVDQGRIDNLNAMDFQFEDIRNDSEEILEKLKQQGPIPAFKRKKP